MHPLMPGRADGNPIPLIHQQRSPAAFRVMDLGCGEVRVDGAGSADEPLAGAFPVGSASVCGAVALLRCLWFREGKHQNGAFALNTTTALGNGAFTFICAPSRKKRTRPLKNRTKSAFITWSCQYAVSVRDGMSMTVVA